MSTQENTQLDNSEFTSIVDKNKKVLLVISPLLLQLLLL